MGKSTSISLALSSQRQSCSNLKVENKDVSRCWSSGIVESCLDGASSDISVNCKHFWSECGGGSSKDSFSDKIWLSEGWDAVNFEVDLSDGIQSGSPCAKSTNSVVNSGSFWARESLDVSGWIFLGIGGISGHCENGWVGGPNSIMRVNSLNPGVIESGWVETCNQCIESIKGNLVNDSRTLSGVVKSE